MQPENEPEPDVEAVRIEEGADGWNIVGPHGLLIGPFPTHAEARAWLDNLARESPSR